ncbi:MAG: putative metal-binding motif-containing protein [Candidatus Kerfeldbacteria bacterium]
MSLFALLLIGAVPLFTSSCVQDIPPSAQSDDDAADDDAADDDASDDDAAGDDDMVNPLDQDGDGYMVMNDCDDADPDVHPGADEVLGDNVDNDCDGEGACQEVIPYDLCPPDDDCITVAGLVHAAPGYYLYVADLEQMFGGECYEVEIPRGTSLWVWRIVDFGTWVETYNAGYDTDMYQCDDADPPEGYDVCPTGEWDELWFHAAAI